MKNSKEMADNVFKMRDAYLEKHRKRRKAIKKMSYIGSTFCIFGAIIVVFHHIQVLDNHISTLDIDTSNVLTTTEKTTENTKHLFENEETSEFTNHSAITKDNVDSEIIIDPEKSESFVTNNVVVDEQPKELLIAVDESEENNLDIKPVQEEQEDKPGSSETSIEEGNIVEEIETTSSNCLLQDLELVQIYEMFPNFIYETEYFSKKETVSEELLEIAIDDINIEGHNEELGIVICVNATIYTFQGSDEQNELAVLFEGRNEYIVYKSNT